MSSDQTIIEVALARMEGKLDLLAQGMEHIREDQRTHGLKQTLLEARVVELEKAQHMEIGEQKGIQKVVRIVYATCGLVGVSAVAAALRYILM